MSSQLSSRSSLAGSRRRSHADAAIVSQWLSEQVPHRALTGAPRAAQLARRQLAPLRPAAVRGAGPRRSA